MISCFLLEVEDSLNGINMANSTGRQLSKAGGGVSFSLTKTRAKGESLRGIENVTAGVLPIMKNIEQSFQHIDQAGQRKGAAAVYLNVLHADIEDFVSTKRISNNLDENFSMPTLSIGVVIPDIFMELLKEDKPVHLFYPHNFYQVTGEYLDEVDMNERYYEFVQNPDIRTKQIHSRDLMTLINATQQESGYPYIMFEGNVTKDHWNEHINKVTKSNLCVTGDTELLTSNGYVTAKELYESGKDLEVIIDNRTKNMNNSENGTSVVEAIPMQLTSKNADVYEIVTNEGFTIKSTDWHKYYVSNDNKQVEKKPLNELSVGDKLLVQSDEGSFGDNSDVDIAYLMGVIAGDGTFDPSGSVKIYLYGEKRKLIGKLERIIHDKIEEFIDVDNVHHSANLKPKFVYDNKKDIYSLSSSLLRDVLNIFDFGKDNKLEFPSYVKNGNKKVLSAYLSGLYKVDGSVNANVKYKSMSYELASINKNLLVDIQKHLLNMGIFSTIYDYKNRRYTTLPNGKGGYSRYEVKPIFKLSVQDRESREIFSDNIELKEKDEKKIKDFNETLSLKSRKPKHNFTATIKSIEYVGKEDVYDTTQEDYHSLIFNGIVTGNCTEIFQASELSIYNDYGEEDDIGLDISCNLGSLNVKSVMESEDKDMERIVRLSIDALNRVSDESDVKNAPGINKANRLMHSVGLGALNLNGFLANNGISYESEDALKFVDYFFSSVRYYAMKRSMEIARKTGETYYKFEGSGYADGSFFDEYIENRLPKDMTPKVEELFNGFKLPTKEDWLQLKEDVMEYGMYNSYLLAVAP